MFTSASIVLPFGEERARLVLEGFSFLESHIYTRMYQAYRIGWMELSLV